MLAVARKRTASRRQKKASRVGLNLRRIRALKSLGQEDVAQGAGLHRVTVSNIESGTIGTVEVDTLEALARALGVRAAELLEVEGEAAPIEPLIQEYLSSPLALLGKPTKPELEWLRSRPTTFWFALRPNIEVVHHVLMAHRAEQPEAD